MSYHYLVASLPPLTLDGAVPMPSAILPEQWESLLSPDDLRDLRSLISGQLEEGRHLCLRRWVDRETQLRDALVHRRAATLHREAGPFLRDHDGFEVDVEEAAARAMAADDPLQREQALDRFRWDSLDDMAAADRFGPAALFAFALKLRIAERWQRMTEAEGRRVLERTISDNLETASAGSSR